MQRRDRGGLMAQIWSPEPTAVADGAFVDRVGAMVYSGRTPLDTALVDMLASLSGRILCDSALHAPQYVALGYWLRPAALHRLGDELAKLDTGGRVRVPRGVALHLPPANVDTLFVYSWAMAVLAGNANIVRLAERIPTDTRRLIGTVCSVVAEHGQSDRNLFCHYRYGGDLERSISRVCDLRLVWGGDAKVEAVSRVAIRPDGLSIGFPDRRSLAVIATGAYRQADTRMRDGLAAAFFNDVFWFDQMGCGSPRTVVWLGDPGDLADDFYRRLQWVVGERCYGVDPSVAMSKFVLANAMLARGITTNYQRHSAALDVSRTADPVAAIAEAHGGGFLCEWVAGSLDEVAHVVTRAVQTITHFGLSAEEVARMARGISGRGGYRIVPVGEALQFDSTWDGVDLFAHMTRQIVVR